MLGEPLQSVDSRLMMVETDADDLVSGVAVTLAFRPGAPGPVDVLRFGPAAFDSRVRSSVTRPCSARGAGSTPRRVNRSAREAKQRRAPSATCNTV